MLQRTTDTVIPWGLANDNFWNYTTGKLYEYDVRWIEQAIASPTFNSMMVLYAEGDYGHLMNEKVGKQQFRTLVKGFLQENPLVALGVKAYILRTRWEWFLEFRDIQML